MTRILANCDQKSAKIDHVSSKIEYVSSSCKEKEFGNHTAAIGNYTAGSQFEKNLNTLLYRTLYIKGGGAISDYEKNGDPPNQVYGLFLCRGDVSAKTCQECIDAATNRILSDCAYKKEAIIWYNQCLIRYSYKSFNSTLESEPSLVYFNSNNITQTKNFSGILRDMFSHLIDQATNIPANRDFAKTQVRFGLYDLYGMVQCTPDLSPSQCQDCLSSVYRILSSLEETRGIRILTPSCNARYELYPFLSDPPLASPDSGNSTDNGTHGKFIIFQQFYIDVT
ncbi:cysteine-rich repeat secretory protein 38-like [Daucus carota subsp. sativus]|uniref:cysteine-rich repeat secretory protein 38-like n=1 Tax=Daucus carota subsp. sativus TaxID=79200 RepID=UPI0030827E86